MNGSRRRCVGVILQDIRAARPCFGLTPSHFATDKSFASIVSPDAARDASGRRLRPLRGPCGRRCVGDHGRTSLNTFTSVCMNWHVTPVCHAIGRRGATAKKRCCADRCCSKKLVAQRVDLISKNRRQPHPPARSIKHSRWATSPKIVKWPVPVGRHSRWQEQMFQQTLKPTGSIPTGPCQRRPGTPQTSPTTGQTSCKGKAGDAQQCWNFDRGPGRIAVARFGRRRRSRQLHNPAAVLPALFLVPLPPHQRPSRPAGRVRHLIADAAAGASLWGQDTRFVIHDKRLLRCPDALDDENFLRGMFFRRQLSLLVLGGMARGCNRSA